MNNERIKSQIDIKCSIILRYIYKKTICDKLKIVKNVLKLLHVSMCCKNMYK